MPAVSSRGKGRRTVNEINMVPFIDVMLVLLIIFMVTAPMLTPGVINVPSTGKSSKPPSEHVARVFIDKNGNYSLKAGDSERSISLKELGAAAAAWQATQPEGSAVVLSADKNLPYETVTAALGELYAAGVKRAALDVKSSAGK